jgi:hypothetical protein
VLYVNLAWLVQLQQQQLSRGRIGNNSSSSSSSRGQQQGVPPWHVQFLAAVGAPAWRAGWRSVGNVQQLVTTQLRSMHSLSQSMQMPGRAMSGCSGAGSSGSTSSSSSGGGASGSTLPSEAGQQQRHSQQSEQLLQQHSFEQLLPARATVLLLLEMILLRPGATRIMLCYPRMHNFWDSMQPNAGNASAQQTTDTMLQPVLHLLGASVLQQLEASASSSSSSSGNDATLGDRSEKFAKWFAALVEWLVAAGAVRLCRQETRVCMLSLPSSATASSCCRPSSVEFMCQPLHSRLPMTIAHSRNCFSGSR